MQKKEMEGIIAAVMELDKIKHHARALGLFTDDRELLECPACGLCEDVTAEGLLVVYQKDDSSQEDSGLRFREFDERHFACPVCGTDVTIEGEVDLVVKESVERYGAEKNIGPENHGIVKE